MAPLQCTNCHGEVKELPHSTPMPKVNCGSCHSDESQQHSKSVHGKALARGDALAPRCVSCHGNHDIVPVKDPRSAVAAIKIPYVCGQCHQEGTPVQLNRNIAQHDILDELQREHSRRGPAEEGPHRRGQLRVMPHGALDPAAHRSRVFDRAAQHRGDLHQVPREHRTGASQDHSRRALGEAIQHAARMRRLPPAAQGAQRFLLAGHGGRRLHALPR